MKNIKFWLIPALFFFVCCVLNLIGCLNYETNTLERTVKPALMPLLCVTTLAYLIGKGVKLDKYVALLVCGQLFGFAGDTMLMGSGFIFFAGGIGLFLTGHIFYLCLFGGFSWKGLSLVKWVIAIAVLLCCTVVLALAIGVEGVMLAPMGIYAFVLFLLIFSGFAGLVRRRAVKRGNTLTWLLIFCGGLLFTFSDSLIAVRNFGTISPFMNGFGVMSTYLAAQSLLAVGGVRLIREK